MLANIHTLLHLKTQQVEALKSKNERLQAENTTLRTDVYALGMEAARLLSLLEDTADADDEANIAEAEAQLRDSECPACTCTPYTGVQMPQLSVRTAARIMGLTDEDTARACSEILSTLESLGLPKTVRDWSAQTKPECIPGDDIPVSRNENIERVCREVTEAVRKAMQPTQPADSDRVRREITEEIHASMTESLLQTTPGDVRQQRLRAAHAKVAAIHKSLIGIANGPHSEATTRLHFLIEDIRDWRNGEAEGD